MHELLLHASVPGHRHDQILSILAGVAAMQPIPVLEKHLIFKPSRPPSITGKAGPQQGGQAGQAGQAGQMKALQGQMHGDLFYLKVVEEVKGEPAAFGEQSSGTNGEGDKGDVLMADDGVADNTESNGTRNVNGNGLAPTSWTLHFRDLPDSNKGRPVTSRAMADIPITSGDPSKFMAAMDYTHTSTLLLSGHRLTHSSILLQLFRPLTIRSPSPSGRDSSAASLGPRTLLESADPIDPSGSYVLQASVRVDDGQKVDRMQQGTTELLNLKEMLKGVVDLEMADRLSMDTRVR